MQVRLLIVSIFLGGCGSWVIPAPTMVGSPDLHNIHPLDTLSLLHPEAIVKKHFGDAHDQFTLEEEEARRAESELIKGIDEFSAGSLVFIKAQGLERCRTDDFKERMKSYLKKSRDTLDYGFSFGRSLQCLPIDTNRLMAFVHLDWDYNTNKYSGELHRRYGYGNDLNINQTLALLVFVVIDPTDGSIKHQRRDIIEGLRNQTPVLTEFRWELYYLMKPLLKEVKKKQSAP